MEKIKVTPQQLGQILFIFALETTNDNLKNKEIVENIGIEKIDHDHLFREMIIINMFAIIQMFQGLLKDEKLENDVLDFMHKTYYKELMEQLKFGKEQIVTEHSNVLARYREYQEAMEEKRGPNWLWPLTNHVLNNLRREETKDAIAMMHLTALFSTLMKVLPDMINKYEVVKN